MAPPEATSCGRLATSFGETWWRITGDLAATRAAGRSPLVVLHGGPGFSHDYTLRIARLAERGRAVIHYDQLGCGRSTHPTGRGAEFWTVQVFLDELDEVLAGLGVADDHVVLGQSWGGMLAAEHAVRRPAGLRGVVLANSPASMELWIAEVTRLRGLLPPDVQESLHRHEQAGTTGSDEYAAATAVFYDRHMCRVVPNPDELVASFAATAADPTVYHLMNGPTDFHCVGTLAGWSVIDRLDRVTVPTLVLNGRHDEATDVCVQPFVDRIPGARRVRFENSSHLPHIEEEELYLRVVGEFLDSCD